LPLINTVIAVDVDLLIRSSQTLNIGRRRLTVGQSDMSSLLSATAQTLGVAVENLLNAIFSQQEVGPSSYDWYFSFTLAVAPSAVGIGAPSDLSAYVIQALGPASTTYPPALQSFLGLTTLPSVTTASSVIVGPINPPPAPTPAPVSDEMSAGMIALTVIMVVIGSILIAITMWYFKHKRSIKLEKMQNGFDSSTTNPEAQGAIENSMPASVHELNEIITRN
jgi:hypothetical protein